MHLGGDTTMTRQDVHGSATHPSDPPEALRTVAAERSPRWDRQQHLVYASERIAHTCWDALHEDRDRLARRLEWDALCAYAEFTYDDALRQPYAHQWRRERLRPTLTIEESPFTHSFARSWEDMLAFADAQWNTWVVLHEVAHLLTRRRGEAAHGWRFATVLRQMVGRHLDPDAAVMLGRIYAWMGVRERRGAWRAPVAPMARRPGRVVVEETLYEVMVERLP
jgi:hypothetical protein